MRNTKLWTSISSARPARTIAAWLIAALVVTLAAPDLTRLVEESQGTLLPADAESRCATASIRAAWPERAPESTVAVMLQRAEGLTPADHDFAARLAARFQAHDRPHALVDVLGPGARPEISARLISRDRTTQLVLVGMATPFVSPIGGDALRWLKIRSAALSPPPGLEIRWTGDAALGQDFMHAIRVSLDRAAVVTVILLLGVLLAVYRSVSLALVPMLTIGVSLLVSRAVLAWMVTAGWDVSPLVELFLVVILFGTGTDFCLLVSWRFAEDWDETAPARAMRRALASAAEPLLTSAGTVIAGLSLMGATRFKLFSSTGPSVAVGVGITVLAALTLTPALLVLLARYRPASFSGFLRRGSGAWDRVGRVVLARPAVVVLAIVAALVGPAVVGLRARVVHDLLAELPAETASARDLRLAADKFGPGAVAPLSVAIRSDRDLRGSEGLALLDDISRLLAGQQNVSEVRSATQPFGSTAPFEEARLSSRLALIDAGLKEIDAGGNRLNEGLEQGAGKIAAQMLVEKGLGLLKGARTAQSDPRDQLRRNLNEAAASAATIARGARRCGMELETILADPVGRRALDRLLLTAENRRRPDVRESLDVYVSADGLLARIDLEPRFRPFAPEGSDDVERLRRLINDSLRGAGWTGTRAEVTGLNAVWADVRSTTRVDQYRLWVLVPLGVFLILVVALRDPWSCVNLVATMILSYAFALGVTHLVFVHVLDVPGLDWTVPYFLFVLLVAVGVDYNVFLMSRVREEARGHGLRRGIERAVGHTGGLITSAAAIAACSFASFLSSPLASIRELGFALVVGLTVDALLVRPVLVPCGHWLLNRGRCEPSAVRSSVPGRMPSAATESVVGL